MVVHLAQLQIHSVVCAEKKTRIVWLIHEAQFDPNTAEDALCNSMDSDTAPPLPFTYVDPIPREHPEAGSVTSRTYVVHIES